MKICIVKLSAMGDIIHAMVVLQFIKKQIPSCQIDWIVEDGFRGVLENNPNIDNVLPVNLKSIKKRKLNIFSQIKLLNTYAQNRYDIVIDAQGLIKSAIVAKIVGGRIVGSKIVGFDKDSTREGIASWFYDEGVDIAYDKNVIDRNVKLFSEALDIKIEKDDILNKEPFLYSKELKIKNSTFSIVINSTSAGLKDENLPAPENIVANILDHGKYAIDCIYGKTTPFLALAEEKNLPSKDGEDMLLYQGVIAFELFTNTKATPELIEAMRMSLKA